MAYLEQEDDIDLSADLLKRKEFYWAKQWKVEKSKYENIIPRFMLQHIISKHSYLKLQGHQVFISNFMNPNTKYKRLHLMWSTGSGKTLGSLAIAMKFIEVYRLESELKQTNIGSVFIIGFAERVFKNELLRFPEFGFITHEERIIMNRLRHIAASGNPNDLIKYKEFAIKIKRRLTNRKGNGFFKFFGYKAFVNRIFVLNNGTNISDMNEDEIRKALKDGTITLNMDLLTEFKNSLIICDEIHNVYNTLEKNNWGVALQTVLDAEPSIRCVTLSATPFNNSPTEVVDLLNLLLPPEQRLVKSDLFVAEKTLKPDAEEKLRRLVKNRFSFLIDTNPKHYPRMTLVGQPIENIPYLKFMRSPMSPLQYATYKSVYNGVLPQGSQHIGDLALPNPDGGEIGITSTDQIRKVIAAAPAKWKERHGIDFVKDKLQGEFLLRSNIAKYSTKYALMLDEITDCIKNDKGKIFIYSNVVHVTGTMFIEQLLIKNGFIDDTSTPNAWTKCAVCGLTMREHPRDLAAASSAHGGSGAISFDELSEMYNLNSVKSASYVDNVGSGVGIAGGGQVDVATATKHTNYASMRGNVDKSPVVRETKCYYNSKLCFVYMCGSAEDIATIEKLFTGKVIVIKVNHEMMSAFKNYRVLDSTSSYDYIYLDKRTEADPDSEEDSDDDESELSKFNVYTIERLEKHIRAELQKITYNMSFKQSVTDVVSNISMSHVLKPNEQHHKHSTRSIGGTNAEPHNVYGTNAEPHNVYGANVGGATHNTTHKSADAAPSSIHQFMPARYIMANSEIDKSRMDYTLEKFNSVDNSNGERIMILVGSRIIKESYDLKAVRNVFIMERPNNIPTFLQIRGRAIRKDSHAALPPEKREVVIKLFTSCLPTKTRGQYDLSYEEEKYKSKVQDFIVIQKIEKIIHENAIDAAINYEKNTGALLDDADKAPRDMLSPLSYTPQHMLKREYSPDELSLSTFNIYHHATEINVVKTLIKRLFIELSSVWEYNDLFEAVRYPPYHYESDISLHSLLEENFLIAINQLCWSADANFVEPYEEMKDTDGTSAVIQHLFSFDKIILLPSGYHNVIVPINDGAKQYFILFPIINNSVKIDIEQPYRVIRQAEQQVININSFVQTKHVDFDYEDKKRIFYRKYADITIESMENVICEYGSIFHMRFLEECVQYVFNIWTDPTKDKDKMHEFYFKMLYYYDLLSLVLWAYTCKSSVMKEYLEYIVPTRAKDIKLKSLSAYEKRADVEQTDNLTNSSEELATSGIINLLKSTYNKTSNVWVPREFRDNFNKVVMLSLEMFNGDKRKTRIKTKVPAEYVPIGHFISKFPRIYHPKRGWDENPTYLQNDMVYIENNIIIGLDEKSATGVHIRFKLRNPIHSIKKYKDQRETEKGTVCKSKSKEFLMGIVAKLGIELDDKINVDELCVLIRSKLIRLELIERVKKSNVKYFYFHYEARPETTV